MPHLSEAGTSLGATTLPRQTQLLSSTALRTVWLVPASIRADKVKAGEESFGKEDLCAWL